MGEVEAQLVRPHRRARLAHVVAEALAQRRVQEVGRGVVAHRRVTRLVVDQGLDRDPGFDLTVLRLHLERLVFADAVDVDHAGLAAVPAQHARVGDLATALGVEGALLELDQRPPVVRDDGGEARRRAQGLVADEARRRRLGGEGDHLLVAVLGAVRGGGADPSALALLLHQLLEAPVVDREALLGEQLLGQVVGEAVGVVQLEGVGGVDPGGAGLLGLGDQPLEQLAAALQRAAEALLLVADPAGDRLALGRELGVGTAHDLDRALGEATEPGRLEAERAALLDRPAHDPAQDVAAVLVGGDDPVGDQEGRAARVVGDDPHRPGHGAALAVGAAGELLGEVDQRPQQVGLEDRGDVLEDRRHPVEAHAGVDVAHRQLGERAVAPKGRRS